MHKSCNKYFIYLNRDEEEAFREYSISLVFKKNHNIFANGDSAEYVYFIEKGRVKIYRLTKDGNTITVAIRHQGELFGLAEAIMEEPRKCFAQTLENTSVLAIKAKDCQEILRSIPELSIKINRVLSYRLRHAEAIIYDLINYNVAGRLARFLISMQDQCGRSVSVGTMLDIKLTHYEIAAMIGSTRQSVTQVLTDFRDDGLIKIVDKKIIIIDRNKLLQRVI